MNNTDEMLRIYQNFKSEPNAPYKITEDDRKAAEIAATHPEYLIRAAAVLSGTYNRHLRKKKK